MKNPIEGLEWNPEDYRFSKLQKNTTPEVHIYFRDDLKVRIDTKRKTLEVKRKVVSYKDPTNPKDQWLTKFYSGAYKALSTDFIRLLFTEGML
jgi:hypothetical protein